MNSSPELCFDLTERVLERLGFNKPPSTDLAGLRKIYHAWCRQVPFDNVQKIIHVSAGDPSPLPGFTAKDYFVRWLKHGTGGTCWASNGTFASLLSSIGFDATRGVGTMMVAPDLPPNHGTVSVLIDGDTYLVDASMLFSEPLLLLEEETAIDNPTWGVRTSIRDGKRFIHWRPLIRPDGFECRIETLSSDASEFEDYHERTRAWSPFNYELATRVIREDSVIGVAFGQRVAFDATGSVTSDPLDEESRLRFLIEEMRYSEEIAAKLPPDQPTPPPPWSATAAASRD